MTKTFVATVVLELAGEGALSLDDTVERWVPGLVPGGDAITVRELLNHTSGLFDYLNDGDGTVIKPYLGGRFSFAWAPRDIVGVAVGHEPHFAPGAGWSYSNTGYIVLGLIVEAASGQPIATALQQRIFTPLALRQTSFDTAPPISGPHAHGYYRLPRQRLQDVTAVSPSFAWSAGAIVSTADDLARFYRALLAGEVLRPDLLQAMETTVPMGVPGEEYGLGLWHTGGAGFGPGFRFGCAATAWGHDGDIPGYLTWVFNDDAGQRQVVAMVNDDALSRRAERSVARVVRTAFCL
jgi:D-alanyl-D-alanine carboxypeptidase